MNYLKLRKIKKIYFGNAQIARALGIKPESARVSAARLSKSGLLIRAKRNVYVPRDKWETLTKDEKFTIANILQVPSYISLMSALEYYGITTQVQRDFIESIAVKRTKQVNIERQVFNYTKINKKLYFGFRKDGAFFIAVPEKAILDVVYLTSLNKYSFDISTLDWGKLNKTLLFKMARGFPEKTAKLLKAYGRL